MTTRQRPVSLFPFRRRLRVEPLEDRRLLALVTVDTLADTINFNDGVTSLREAIFATNLVGGADTIDFSSSLTSAGPATIMLTQGELVITDSLTINGPGANLLTIDASGNDPTPDSTLTDGDITNDGDGSRVFNIDDGNSANLLDVAISGLTITGGDVTDSGGAIRTVENFMVADCTITGNSASRGGGINSSYASLTVIGSTIDGNSAGSDGGGIHITTLGNATFASSTISGNTAVGNGGGIAIYNTTLSVLHSTIAFNHADGRGGGIYESSGAVALDHTIVALNLSPNAHGGQLYGGFTTPMTARFSFIGNNRGAVITSLAGNQIGTGVMQLDPLLGPLADNGGPTQTHALLFGSPAVNRGDWAAAAGIAGVPEFDQRGAGFPRVGQGRIDIGAYESDFAAGASLIVDTLTDELDGDLSPGDVSLREAIWLANVSLGSPTISFDAALTSDGSATVLLTMGELVIADSVMIDGPDAALLTIDSSGNDPTPGEIDKRGTRVFKVADDTTGPLLDVTIRGLTLTGGDIGELGGNQSLAYGGAISNSENLILDGCIIVGNWAEYGGGGIFNGGNLTVVRSTFTGNRATWGGAISTSNGMLTLTDSTLSNNWSVYGGAIFKSGVQSLGSVTIMGTTISGNSTYRGGGIWFGNGTLEVTASTLSGNTATGTGGAIFQNGGNVVISGSVITANAAGTGSGAGDGGGIYRGNGNLTITATTINNNSTTRSGGGVASSSSTSPPFGAGNSITVVGCTISDNSAGIDGGGIVSSNGTNNVFTITGSTISGNAADHDGGGIFSRGPGSFIIVNSTVSGNSADNNHGGGIWTDATSALRPFTAMNITISGNSAINGAGVFSQGNTVLRHATVAFNTTNGVGRGIFVNSGALSLDHAIVAWNQGSPSGDINGLLGTTISARYSLIGNNQGSGLAAAPVGSPDANGNLIGTSSAAISPQLGLLANNGGPTMTHALSTISPAIDAGDPSFATPPDFDQRGAPFTRVAGARIDMGALEAQPVPAAVFGDYNQDSHSDAADYVVWRKMLGTTDVSPYSAADGDGDSAIGDGDYHVWSTQFGQPFLPTAATGPSTMSLTAPDNALEIRRQASPDLLSSEPQPAVRHTFRKPAPFDLSGDNLALLPWLTSRPNQSSDAARFESSANLKDHDWPSEELRLESIDHAFENLARFLTRRMAAPRAHG